MSGSAIEVGDRASDPARAGMAAAASPVAASLLAQLGFEQLVALAERLAADHEGPAVVALYRAWITAQPAGAPHLYAAWFNLGAELSRAGEVQAAMLSYQCSLSLRPDFALAAINLGLLQERCGDEAGALHTWQPGDAARRGAHRADQPAGTLTGGEGPAAAG